MARTQLNERNELENFWLFYAFSLDMTFSRRIGACALATELLLRYLSED